MKFLYAWFFVTRPFEYLYTLLYFVRARNGLEKSKITSSIHRHRKKKEKLHARSIIPFLPYDIPHGKEKKTDKNALKVVVENITPKHNFASRKVYGKSPPFSKV